MEKDVHALEALAQTYFDAAYTMDAEAFASIFDRNSAVTRIGDDGQIMVMPIASWLGVVRATEAPQERRLERNDQLLSIDVDEELAVMKIKLQMPPLHFTDILSCLKVQGRWKIAQKVTRKSSEADR